MKKILYWLPRILAILYTLFISTFALDVFEESQWFLALVIHLIPSYILIIITTIAWRHEQFGGALFIILGIFLLVYLHFESLVISIPIMIIGLFFIVKNYLLKICRS